MKKKCEACGFEWGTKEFGKLCPCCLYGIPLEDGEKVSD
jgi:hypothetical protein